MCSQEKTDTGPVTSGWVASPFVPGRGHVPPYLAGRSDEQAALQGQLAYLEQGRGAPRETILVGPRGNGKTALMRWFEQDIHDTAEQVDVVWLTPDDIPDLDKLANRLAPPSRFKQLLPETLSVALGGARLSWALGGEPGCLTDLLTARCARQPLTVLLDEAHTLDPDLGRSLLNTSQKVSSKAPFLLALAGTPGLRAHLNRMSATFWNRAQKLGIGRLDEAAAGEALTRPFAEQGLRFADATLRQVVGESQCYPYFIQLWGQALWTQAQQRGAGIIDAQLLDRAGAEVAPERDDYYQDRYTELEEQGLLAAAAAVGAAFASRNELHDPALAEALAGAPVGPDLPPAVIRTRRALQDLGYLWQYPGRAVWEPGIPSLMGYVNARVRPPVSPDKYNTPAIPPHRA